VDLLHAVRLGAGAKGRLRARRASAEQNRRASFHLCVSRASAIIASNMDASGRRYRAGDSLEDYCRACKTDRMHTVVVADADGQPIRVSCGFCHSEHNYRGGPRVGLVPGSARANALGAEVRGAEAAKRVALRETDRAALRERDR